MEYAISLRGNCRNTFLSYVLGYLAVIASIDPLVRCLNLLLCRYAKVCHWSLMYQSLNSNLSIPRFRLKKWAQDWYKISMERAENKDIKTCLSILRSALKDFHRISLTQEDMRSRPLLAFPSKKKVSRRSLVLITRRKSRETSMRHSVPMPAKKFVITIFQFKDMIWISAVWPRHCEGSVESWTRADMKIKSAQQV